MTVSPSPRHTGDVEAPLRYHALATDYDGTLAHDGRVRPDVLAATDKLRHSGRRLILVTGRRLDHLLEVFPETQRFDRIVAENGALLFDPSTQKQTLLAE